MKIIKSLYFIGSLLRTDNALKIDSQYKELVNKNPKIQSKEFSLEKNYIDSIFNLSDVATKTKASSDVATKPKTSSPPHNKKTFEAVKISSFIPQKMQIIEFPHKNNHKPEENNKNRIFCDEVAFHQLKSDNDLSKLIGMTPNDSKDTNATLNSTNHPPLQNDFLLRIKK